jgi:hypothetical protein
MIPEEVYRIKYLLDSFLGDSKSDLTESYQLEYPCPRCVEKYGNNEIRKYNLSVTLVKGGGLFNCWKCSDEDDHEMHGTIVRLIKLYGNEKIMKEYKSLFGEDGIVQVDHAGLECSVILGKYPWLDVVSLGPTMKSPHTTTERALIKTVEPFWQLLKKTLEDIPEK